LPDQAPAALLPGPFCYLPAGLLLTRPYDLMRLI